MNRLDKSTLKTLTRMPKTSTSMEKAPISDNEHAKPKKVMNKNHKKPLTSILEASMSITMRSTHRLEDFGHAIRICCEVLL